MINATTFEHLNEKRIKIVFVCLIALIVPALVFGATKNETLIAVVDALWLSAVFIFVFNDIATIRASYTTKIIIVLGLVLHVFVALLAVYGFGSISEYISEYISGFDQIGFYDQGISYYNGDFSGYYTNFPYILCVIFHIFGPFRIVPQMINILLWYLGLKIIEKTDEGDFYGRHDTVDGIYYRLCPPYQESVL